MAKAKLVKEFLEYIKENKKLWLIPVIIVLAMTGLVLVVTQSQAIASIIYTLF